MIDVPWILGLDGGGTKTVALAADLAGRTLGRCERGAANYHVVGLSEFAALLGSIIEELTHAAGLAGRDLVLISLGLAGADRPRDRELIQAAIAEQAFTCPVLVSSDARIALAAGLGAREEGIVLIAGTGSIAYGVNRESETIRAGGWGHIVSDEGSGYDIGRQALARSLRSWEGRDKPSLLPSEICRRLGLANLSELVGFVHNPATAKADIAALATLVIAAAEQGDALAGDIVDEAAGSLAGLVQSVIDRGFPGRAAVPVATYGGLLLGCPQLRCQVADKLAPQAIFLPPGPEPVMGALKIGYDYLKDG